MRPARTRLLRVTTLRGVGRAASAAPESPFSIESDWQGESQEKLPVNLRGFAVNNHIIFYRPFEGGIDILRVLHGSRDIGSIFEGFFESL